MSSRIWKLEMDSDDWVILLILFIGSLFLMFVNWLIDK